jgi:hypothetical protein
MDSWSDRQIAFMTAGGNTRAQEWLERFNVKEVDLKNKYSCPALEAYREKLKAAVEKRDYVDPTPEEIAKKASPYGSRNGSPSLGGAFSGSSSPQPAYLSQSSRNGLNSSSNGGNLSRSGGFQQSQQPYSMSSSGERFGRDSSVGYENGHGDSSSGDMRTRFAGRNAIGSHDFEPSSRSSPSHQQSGNGDDDIMNAFFDGWSRFSTGVKQVASSAAEKVSSGTLTGEVSQLATKVAESQTWNYVTSFFAGTEGSEQQQQQQQQRPPPTRDEKSYSSDRPPPSAHGQRAENGYSASHRDDYDGRRDDGAVQGFGSGERQGSGSGGGSGVGRYDDPNQQRSHSAQPHRSDGGWGNERMDSSRPTGERQGLRYDSRDSPQQQHHHQQQPRPHSTNPSRSANGWGGNGDSWDDWDSHRKDGGSNPAVAMEDDDVVVDDYKPSVVTPKPTRPATTSDDIYDFQIAPTTKTSTSTGTPTTASPGWDDWDDWGRGKK